MLGVSYGENCTQAFLGSYTPNAECEGVKRVMVLGVDGGGGDDGGNVDGEGVKGTDGGVLSGGASCGVA